MLSQSQTLVLNDARQLVAEQVELARAAPATGAISDVVAKPFGQGYVMGMIDALCQENDAPFDAVALGIFGIVLDEVCARDTAAERGAALGLLRAPSEAFEKGYHYGGNEATGWKARKCVPSALVMMARKRT